MTTRLTQRVKGTLKAEPYVARLRELSPTIQQAQDIIGQFRHLLRTRDLAGFRAWLPHACGARCRKCGGLPVGCCRDRSAVEAAFV